MTRRPVRIGAGLILASALAIMLPSQASAASSPVVPFPRPCPVAVNPSADAAPQLRAFCQELQSLRTRANRGFEKHYKAATRRRIRRLASSEARRHFPSVQARTATSSSVVYVNGFTWVARDWLATIRTYAKKSLKVLKTAVGGAVRFIPQAKVVNCAIFGAFGTVAPLLNGADLGAVAVGAFTGCVGAILYKMKEKQ